MAEYMLQVSTIWGDFGRLVFLMAFPTNNDVRDHGENPKNIWGTGKMKFGSLMRAYPSLILWLS